MGEAAFQPSQELVLKLGAIVARLDHYLSPAGSLGDMVKLDRSLQDAEVRAWLEQIARHLPADRPLFPGLG
jgi:hypothetical protein